MHEFSQSFTFECGPQTTLGICDHNDCVSLSLSSAHVEPFRTEIPDTKGPNYRSEHKYWRIQPGCTIQVRHEQLPYLEELIKVLKTHKKKNSEPVKECNCD